jgi:hypothetical protein
MAALSSVKKYSLPNTQFLVHSSISLPQNEVYKKLYEKIEFL